MRKKQSPMILAGTAFFLFSLLLLPFSHDESHELAPDRRPQVLPRRVKLKGRATDDEKTRAQAKQSAPSNSGTTIDKTPRDLSQRYFGRVVDKHGFGLAGCKVYLSDDWDRFEPSKPQLYDELRKAQKTAKTIHTSVSRLEAANKSAPQTYEAVTDIDGRYTIELEQVITKAPLLKIEGAKGFQDLCRQVTLPKNKDFGDTVLQQTGKVFGSVSNMAHEIVENAGVVLVTADHFEKYLQSSNIEIGWQPHRVTKSDGAYEFDNVPAGRYYLACKAAKTRESSVPVTVQAGSIIRQDLVLRPGLRIELTLQDKEGHAIPNAKVTLRSTDPWYVFNEYESQIRESRDDVHGTTDKQGQASLVLSHL